jgi:16S rRNA U1498 N3-methylase RsmE
MDNKQYADLYLDVSAELERLEADVENKRRLRDYLREKAEQCGNNTPPGRSPRTPGSRRFAKSKQIDAAKVVLSEASEPLKTREIAKRLIDGGFPSDDLPKLKTSLFTTMTRKEGIFEKAGPGLWKLKAIEA